MEKIEHQSTEKLNTSSSSASQLVQTNLNNHSIEESLKNIQSYSSFSLPKTEVFDKKRQIFKVQHINEKITIYIDKNKRKYRTLFKCIYCNEVSYSINRFNSHMRKHVSK